METPVAVERICVKFKREMSTSSDGFSTPSFIRSTMFVPPAMNLELPFADIARTALSTSTARVYLNGCMAFLLLLRVQHAKRVRRFARMDLPDRIDDVRIRSAAAQISAHP